MAFFRFRPIDFSLSKRAKAEYFQGLSSVGTPPGTLQRPETQNPPEPNPMFKSSSHAPDQALKNYVLIIYALQAASYLTVISYFVAPLLAYWKRKDAQGSWLETHLRWQLNSFFYSLIGLAVGILAFATPVGLPILAVTSMWFVYRIGQGWTRLSRSQPITGEKANA
jgi:uncharacterized membrane protein